MSMEAMQEATWKLLKDRQEADDKEDEEMQEEQGAQQEWINVNKS